MIVTYSWWFTFSASSCTFFGRWKWRIFLQLGCWRWSVVQMFIVFVTIWWWWWTRSDAVRITGEPILFGQSSNWAQLWVCLNYFVCWMEEVSVYSGWIPKTGCWCLICFTCKKSVSLSKCPFTMDVDFEVNSLPKNLEKTQQRFFSRFFVTSLWLVKKHWFVCYFFEW